MVEASIACLIIKLVRTVMRDLKFIRFHFSRQAYRAAELVYEELKRPVNRASGNG